MRTLLQTIIPNVVVAPTMPSSRENASVTSTDQRRRRQDEESTTHTTVAPLSASVHGRTKSIDSSMPGIVDVGLGENGNPGSMYHPQNENIHPFFQPVVSSVSKIYMISRFICFSPLGQRCSALMTSLCMHREPSAISSCISESVEDLFSNVAYTFLRIVSLCTKSVNLFNTCLRFLVKSVRFTFSYFIQTLFGSFSSNSAHLMIFSLYTEYTT